LLSVVEQCGLITKDTNLQSQGHYVYITRNINDYSINEFKISLSYETWAVFSALTTILM
jgi:hypothetical protein